MKFPKMNQGLKMCSVRQRKATKTTKMLEIQDDKLNQIKIKWIADS